MADIRPSRDDTCMNIATLLSSRSTCRLAAVGVVISRDGRVLSTGYNGAPAKMEHCTHTEGWGDNTPICDISVHAEANAIAYAARWGISLEYSEMFSTHWACINCAKLIINAGILRVTAIYPYRDEKGVNLLQRAGIEVVQWGS